MVVSFRLYYMVFKRKIKKSREYEYEKEMPKKKKHAVMSGARNSMHGTELTASTLCLIFLTGSGPCD